MKAPHFLRLAQIDEQHFITACRHGLVHLTWGRSTIRFRRDEFRRLAGLLARAADALPLDRAPGPSTARDGRMQITFRLDDDCELQVGPLVLRLNPDEFQDLLQAAQEAVQCLDRFLASGAWDEPEADDALPDTPEPFRRFPFSQN